MAEELKVLGGFSPYALRVELAYENVVENMASKSPELLKYNPVHKKIPVLVHNGKPISESLIIVEYIDDTWKHNPFLPQDAYEKAIARFWAAFVDNKLMEAMRGIIISTEEEQKQKEVEKAKEALQVLDGELKSKGKKFFGGDTVGFVDVAMGWFPAWVVAVEKTVDVKIHDPEKFPLLDEWIQNFTQVPVVKGILPDVDKLVEYLNSLSSLSA